MNKTIQEHYVRRAGGLYKGTRADQPAAGGAQRWDRQPVGWPVGPVVFLHTPAFYHLAPRTLPPPFNLYLIKWSWFWTLWEKFTTRRYTDVLRANYTDLVIRVTPLLAMHGAITAVNTAAFTVEK